MLQAYSINLIFHKNFYLLVESEEYKIFRKIIDFLRVLEECNKLLRVDFSNVQEFKNKAEGLIGSNYGFDSINMYLYENDMLSVCRRLIKVFEALREQKEAYVKVLKKRYDRSCAKASWVTSFKSLAKLIEAIKLYAGPIIAEKAETESNADNNSSISELLEKNDFVFDLPKEEPKIIYIEHKNQTLATSPLMPERRRERSFDKTSLSFTPSIEKRRTKSLKRIDIYNGLMNRSQNSEKNLVSGIWESRETKNIEEQLIDLCSGKKNRVETLKNVLMQRFPEIVDVSRNNEAIKITLSNGEVVGGGHVSHKGSASVTFEHELASKIFEIRHNNTKKEENRNKPTQSFKKK